MRVNVWIPDKLLKKLDKVVLKAGGTRSKYISDLINIQIGKVETIHPSEFKSKKHRIEKEEGFDYKPCKHGLDPSLCKDRKCRRT